MMKTLDAIWEEFNPELLYYIEKRVKNTYDAEDILQDVFIKVHTHIQKANTVSNLRGWIYTITKNSIIDYYRKTKHAPMELDDIEKKKYADITVATENMNDDICRCIQNMVMELPPKYQQAIQLYEGKEMKHKDISKELDISLSASKVRLKRAKEKLKKELLNCCDLELDTFGNIIDYTEKNNYCSHHDYQ